MARDEFVEFAASLLVRLFWSDALFNNLPDNIKTFHHTSPGIIIFEKGAIFLHFLKKSGNKRRLMKGANI